MTRLFKIGTILTLSAIVLASSGITDASHRGSGNGLGQGVGAFPEEVGGPINIGGSDGSSSPSAIKRGNSVSSKDQHIPPKSPSGRADAVEDEPSEDERPAPPTRQGIFHRLRKFLPGRAAKKTVLVNDERPKVEDSSEAGKGGLRRLLPKDVYKRIKNILRAMKAGVYSKYEAMKAIKDTIVNYFRRKWQERKERRAAAKADAEQRKLALSKELEPNFEEGADQYRANREKSEVDRNVDIENRGGAQ